MGDSMAAPDMAGYLMWLCNARSCAITYARTRALPEVARHLAARTEARYTPAVGSGRAS